MTHRRVPPIQIDSLPEISYLKLSPIYPLFDPLSFAKSKEPNAVDVKLPKPRKLKTAKPHESIKSKTPKANYAREIKTAMKTLADKNLKFPLSVKTPEAQLSRLKRFTLSIESLNPADFSRLNSPITQSIKKLNEVSKAEERAFTSRGKSTTHSDIEKSYSLSHLMMVQKNPLKYKLHHSPSNIFPYLTSTPVPIPSTPEPDATMLELISPYKKKAKLSACDTISQNCVALQQSSRQLKSTISRSYKSFVDSFRMFKRHTQLVEVSNQRAGLYVLREEIRKSKESRSTKLHK